MLARFYGWTDQEIENLTLEKAEEYFSMIEIIDARETLIMLSSSSFPHLTKSSREKTHRAVYEKAFPSAFDPNRIVKISEIGNVLGGIKRG